MNKEINNKKWKDRFIKKLSKEKSYHLPEWLIDFIEKELTQQREEVLKGIKDIITYLEEAELMSTDNEAKIYKSIKESLKEL